MFMIAFSRHHFTTSFSRHPPQFVAFSLRFQATVFPFSSFRYTGPCAQTHSSTAL